MRSIKGFFKRTLGIKSKEICKPDKHLSKQQKICKGGCKQIICDKCSAPGPDRKPSTKCFDCVAKEEVKEEEEEKSEDIDPIPSPKAAAAAVVDKTPIRLPEKKTQQYVPEAGKIIKTSDVRGLVYEHYISKLICFLRGENAQVTNALTFQMTLKWITDQCDMLDQN